MNDIKSKVEEIYPRVVSWRRDIHMYPELSGEERMTAAKISEILKQLPIEVIESVGGNGVVGILRGGKKGRTIALRADIDALPIKEENEHSFVSKHEGIMHACGHDGHTAILLGTACILSSYKNEISGNIKFIFQPAEEKAPIGGAKPMIEAGVLENPHVDGILGLHIWPNVPKGAIGIKEGPLMASSDPFVIEIFGQSGHASAPHQTIDALYTACQVVNMLQMIVSRNTDPLESAVVTAGTIKSGTKYNIIADYALIEGTVRTLSPDTQQNVQRRISEVVEGVCKSTGARYSVNYKRGYPAIINDVKMTNLIKKSAESVLPKENIVQVERPAMGGEDFANYLQEVPGAFFWLGAKPEKYYPAHNPRFDFDEEVMKTGMEILSHCALNYLSE